MSDVQFPIRSDAHADESGLGYCLRLAELNGAGLSQLKRIAGLSPNDSFRSIHAATLARLFQAESSVLMHRLPDLSSKKAAIYGHRFERKGMLRIRKAQICPSCIHESGYAKDTWDIGIAVCCLIHRRYLVDRCPKCKSGICWSRFSIKWCNCGQYLGIDPGLMSPCKDIEAAQRILEQILHKNSEVQDCALIPAMRPFTRMSLSGWIELLFALGLRERPWQPISFGTFSFSPSASQTQKLVLRAIRHLKALVTHDTLPKSLTHTIYEGLLSHLALSATPEADRTLCRQLYKTVFGTDRLLRLRRHTLAPTQLDMFMELS